MENGKPLYLPKGKTFKVLNQQCAGKCFTTNSPAGRGGVGLFCGNCQFLSVNISVMPKLRQIVGI